MTNVANVYYLFCHDAVPFSAGAFYVCIDSKWIDRFFFCVCVAVEHLTKRLNKQNAKEERKNVMESKAAWQIGKLHLCIADIRLKTRKIPKRFPLNGKQFTKHQ